MKDDRFMLTNLQVARHSTVLATWAEAYEDPFHKVEFCMDEESGYLDVDEDEDAPHCVIDTRWESSKCFQVQGGIHGLLFLSGKYHVGLRATSTIVLSWVDPHEAKILDDGTVCVPRAIPFAKGPLLRMGAIVSGFALMCGKPLVVHGACTRSGDAVHVGDYGTAWSTGDSTPARAGAHGTAKCDSGTGTAEAGVGGRVAGNSGATLRIAKYNGGFMTAQVGGQLDRRITPRVFYEEVKGRLVESPNQSLTDCFEVISPGGTGSLKAARKYSRGLLKT